MCEAKAKNGLLSPDDMDETLYNALKPDELEKIVKCRFCSRKFTFLSEHLAHMKTHTHNVESIVEMSIKVGRKSFKRLKCPMGFLSNNLPIASPFY